MQTNSFLPEKPQIADILIQQIILELTLNVDYENTGCRHG
jgi:hypothetical protein